MIYFEISDYPKAFKISESNLTRPWGGYWCISHEEIDRFIDEYFNEKKETLTNTEKKLPISPKILFVLAEKRLSWQYHHRRSEVWKVIQGPVGIVRSEDDTEKPLEVLESGTLIEFKAGERHRLVGLDKLGIVAELWRHLDPNNPSNEDDIVRLQDDFGR